MPKKPSKKESAALGFLADENVPTDVSDFIAFRGYRVAHIGRSAPYLLQAPATGTPDALLKKAVQSLIFITQDKRLVRPGAFPNDHRGIFVLDTGGPKAIDLVIQLFRDIRWADDVRFRIRKFVVSEGAIEEVAPGGTALGRQAQS